VSTQVIVALVCRVSFAITLLVLAIKFPIPTPFQHTVFRIVLSLPAAGFAAMMPAFIDLKINPGSLLYLQAGGALAVFAVVFFFDPAPLALLPPKVPMETPANQPANPQTGLNNPLRRQ